MRVLDVSRDFLVGVFLNPAGSAGEHCLDMRVVRLTVDEWNIAEAAISAEIVLVQLFFLGHGKLILWSTENGRSGDLGPRLINDGDGLSKGRRR